MYARIQTQHDVAKNWSDESIKALALEDRQAAIEILTDKYHKRLYYHAFYIVKNGEEARDVIQEVFIKAIREHRLFDAEFRIKPWLYRVTSNLCFNIVRNKKRRGAILETIPFATNSAARQVEWVFANQLQKELVAAMDKMSPNHKEILILRYFDDLSYTEIAEVLGVKLGTVMSRLSRARVRLLQMVESRKDDLT